MTNNRKIRTARHQRCGIATLELVMSAPLLLALMVSIVWLGFGVAAQSRTTVKARNDAWHKRHDSKASEPLFFLSDGLIDSSAEEHFEVTPLMKQWSHADSKHVVMGGSWDHRQMPMDSSPNWSLQAKVAANAKTADLQNIYSMVSGLQSMAGQLLVKAMSFESDLKSRNNQFDGGVEEKRKANELKRQKHKDELKQDINRLESEITGIQKELDVLQQSLNSATNESQREQIKNRVKFLEGKQLRLIEERNETNRELQAMD